MIACNQVILIGEIVSEEINLSSQSNGSQYLAFNLLTKENWYNRQTGTYTEHKETHRIVLRDNGAYKMASRYKNVLKTGEKLLVSGCLRYKSRTQEDGSVNRFVEIDCIGIEKLYSENAELKSQTRIEENKESSLANFRSEFNSLGIDFSAQR